MRTQQVEAFIYIHWKIYRLSPQLFLYDGSARLGGFKTTNVYQENAYDSACPALAIVATVCGPVLDCTCKYFCEGWGGSIIERDRACVLWHP